LRSVVVPTQAPDQTSVKFPSVSQTDSPYETPVPRSAIAIDSRTTSLTPSDSASNIHINYADGTATIPGTVAGSVLGSVLLEPSVGKKSKRDKNRSVLSTITSASYSTTKPSTEELQQPPAPTPPVPQISIPGSPSISSSIGGSRLTTNPSTPAVARSLKSSLTSSLSYATNHPEPPPPQLPAMSRQNSDTGSVIAGGFGSALGGVLTGVWGSYKSATPSPVVENPPPGPATTGFESTLETIHDVEVPGGFGGEREEASVSSRELIPEPTIIPPSPPKFEEPRVTTPKIEVPDVPAYETETVPETPVEPEPSVLSAVEKRKTKKQRDKEKRDKEAQEKKEREERERLEQEERDKQERERKKAEKEAKKREREEREREQREQEERAEQERVEREARERAEWEAREQAEREAREQAEREAREQAEREARKREKEAKDRAEREAREAKEQAEREAREQAEKAAMEKMDKVTRRRAEREAAKRAEQEAKERAEREAAERAEREAKEKAEEAARAKAERIAKRKAEREAREQAEREAKEKADQEAREKAEKEAKERVERQERERRKKEEERAERERIENERVEKERIEKERIEKARIERERIENERVEKERVEKEEREKAEREAKEKADHEAKEREEAEKAKTLASKTPSARGSTVGKNDRSRKTSTLSKKEQKNEWAGAWDFNSTEKEESSGLLPILTSSGPGGIFDGAGDFWSAGKNDSPGGAEELELRTPLTKKGADSLSNLSKVDTVTGPADISKLDPPEDPNTIVSARVSVSSRSENERWTDAEQGPSPTEPTPPILAPGLSPETLLSTTPDLLKTSKEVKDEAPTTPKPWPTPALPSSRQSQVPPPAPAKTEPEKPLSLWERKRPKVASPPASASSLFGGGDGINSSGVWGNSSGGGGNAETIAMPNLVGDRQSVFTDTARDQKRENQREGVVEGLLGATPVRRRNDSAQSQVPAKHTPKPAPAPAPAPQKSSGWGSWGSSLLNTVASAVAAPDRSPSPEPPPVKPKIEDPPRGFTPSQPPKSQPAGFGSLKQPGWGGPGGSADNNAWGAAKTGPTPIAQKPSTGPAWGTKPAGSSFGSGGTGWGSGTGPAFSSNVGKNLSVDTAARPLESGPNTAGPENIPESAVEIKHVPAPGGFGSVITDKKEEAGDAQDDAQGWEEAPENKGTKKASKLPSPPQEKEPEPQIEVTEEPAKAEEAATPAEEDEFDWANQTKKKKKGQAASVAQSQTTSAQNTPDPENADDGAGGGGGGSKKKKRGKGKK
jgi:hypothetical protein